MWKQILALSLKRGNPWFYAALSVLVALILSVLQPTPSYGSWLDTLIRGVQIIQLSTMSDAQEVKLGGQINQQLIEQGQIKINQNSQINQYINNIGERLAASSDRPNIPYTFLVVADNNINAFATMGGFVYLNTGLIRLAENEAELASVIAHEIGHISARHSIHQMREAALTQGLLSAAGLDQSNAVQIGVQLALDLPNSRSDELEADQLGLATLERGGYAPIAMIAFMDKLLQQSDSNSVPTFLSTHPATQDRIAALEESIDLSRGNQGDGLNSRVYRKNISPSVITFL